MGDCGKPQNWISRPYPRPLLTGELPMKSLLITFLALASVSAHAFTPDSITRLEILTAAAKSKLTDKTTQARISSLTAPMPYETRVSIISFDCSNGKSTSADYAFMCEIHYGVDDLNDDDTGYGATYKIFIDGTVQKNQRKIEYIRSELFAG